MAKANTNGDKNNRTTETNGELPMGVRRYDFRIARKLSQPQRIWLGSMHSRLANQLTQVFEGIFHCETEIAFMGLEQIQGSAFQETDHTKVFNGVIALRPGNGRLHILWPREMGFFFVEKLLGGTGDSLFMEKELSDFERDILKRFTNLTFQALQQVFEGSVHPQGECCRIGEGPESFTEVLPYEVLLVGSLNVRINGHQGKLTLIYPHSVVKSWVDNTAPSPEAPVVTMASPFSSDGLVWGVAKAPVTVQVRMNATRIKVSDFTSLQVGDCLLLNHSTTEPVNVYVEEKLKFKGQVGSQSGQLGIKLISQAKQAWTQSDYPQGRA